MNIIIKLGFKKYYVAAYFLSIVAIFFYSSLFFFSAFFIFLQEKTNTYFESIPFLDLRLSLFILALIVVCIVFMLFLYIKCPRCGNKFFWHWFNDSRHQNIKKSPFIMMTCPNCNYDPDKDTLNMENN